MTVYEMLYDLDFKMSGVDNAQYRRFGHEEKFWLLNQAQDAFIKAVAFPHLDEHQAFENTQRTIDDIRNIVVPNLVLTATLFDKNRRIYSVNLPRNYRHHVSSQSLAVKSGCKKYLRNFPVRHGEMHEENAFSASDFEWEECNMSLVEKGKMLLYAKDDFDIRNVILNYVRRPVFIHAADRLPEEEFVLPGGERLTDFQNCELSEDTHQDIVNWAVLIATVGLQQGDVSSKAAGVALTK